MKVRTEPGPLVFGVKVLGHSPTEATQLRFDLTENRLHLIHGKSSTHRGRAGGISAITN
jgi:hypothetical protein